MAFTFDPEKSARNVASRGLSFELVERLDWEKALVVEDDRAFRPDEDNPEWTAGDFARARPASEVLPKFMGQAATDELLRRGRGRPAKLNRKVNQTLRLDPDVLEAYRREGPGWQALINEVLRQHMPRHGK